MLLFGIDVPLVEVVFFLAVMMFVLFLEAIVIITLLLRHLNQAKDFNSSAQRVSEALLSMKKAELEELEKVKKS